VVIWSWLRPKVRFIQQSRWMSERARVPVTGRWSGEDRALAAEI